MTEQNKKWVTLFKTRIMPVIVAIIMVSWFFVIAITSN